MYKEKKKTSKQKKTRKKNEKPNKTKIKKQRKETITEEYLPSNNDRKIC